MWIIKQARQYNLYKNNRYIRTAGYSHLGGFASSFLYILFVIIKMDNREKIMKIINSWHIAQVYDRGSYFYCLCSSIEGNWNIRRSRWEKNALRSYDYLGYLTWFEGDFDDRRYDISVYQKQVRYPKPWDKVEILESVKQSPFYDDWWFEQKEMIWWPYIVKRLWSQHCSIISNNIDNYYSFDYRHIAPWVYGDKKKEDNMSWKRVAVTIDGIEYKATID